LLQFATSCTYVFHVTLKINGSDFRNTNLFDCVTDIVFMEYVQNIYISFIITSWLSRERSVGIVLRLRATNIIFSPQIPDQTSPGVHPNSHVLDTRSYFYEGKIAGT
jgi:hypothetical protein